MTGPLRILFERTLRLPDDGRRHPLPPGLGALPSRRVAELAGSGHRAPSGWEADDLVLPLHDREALFLAFSGESWKPSAVRIGTGGIDAVSGAAWDDQLRSEPQNYLVCPPQPWLDGINSGAGTIRQFVAVPLGRGHTIEAQVRGEEKIGGLQILVYAPKPGRFPEEPPPEDASGMAFESCGLESVGFAEMGLGAGGTMQQKIYPDPYGIDTWEPEPVAALRVRLVQARDWEALTGEPAPPTPVTAELAAALGLPWFELDDAERGDIAPAPALARVRSIQQMEGGHAVNPSETVERTRRLLPDLERVQEILRTTSSQELLRGTLPAAQAEAVPESMAESGLEGVPSPQAEPPRQDAVEDALQAEREATIEAGQRGIERVLQEGPEAPLSAEEQFGLEAIVLLVGRPALLIQGGRFAAAPADWSILEENRDAIQTTIRSVGRIEVEGHPNLEWIGTGFLVARDVVMTNRHVALEFTAPRGDGRWGVTPGIRARIDFREEFQGMRSSEFRIKGLIGIHGRYDMALFRLEPASGLPEPLPLSSGPGPVEKLPGRNVYVVGYPAWDGRRNDPEPMQRLFANVYNVKRLQPGGFMRYLTGQNLFTHDCSTLGGNSGSPVIDLESHRIIGLHYGGLYQRLNNAVALWELRQDPLIRFAGLQFA
jgi:Trypsin-like peptidase domain